MSTISDALKKTKEAYFLVDLDFGGLVKRYAEKDITVPYSSGSEKLFKCAIMNRLSVGSSYNLRATQYTRTGVNVTLANTERLQDEEARHRMEAATVTIYVWCPGLDWAEIETDGVLFRGIFEKKHHTLTEYAFSIQDLMHGQGKTLPETTINEGRWSNLRKEGGAGSVAGLPQAIVFGDWPKGVPLKCVDTSGYKYLACAGKAKSADSDYTGATENVYDKDGSVIGAANYTFYSGGLDGKGQVVAYFDFTGDRAANEPLSCSMQGLSDGSGEFTGTAGALIEHPAQIVHYLLEKHTNLDRDHIDVERLKTMASLLPGVKFASIVNKQTDSIDVVDRMLAQCMAARIVSGGKVGVMTPVTSGPVIGRTHKAMNILERSIRISRTPREEICNNLKVQYALNPTTGEYEEELSRDRTNNSECNKSYLQYGEAPEVVLRMADVQEEATAIQLADRYIGQKAFQHDVVECAVPWWDGFDVREGDIGILTAEEGPSAYGEGWSEEECVLLERTFKGNQIEQKWWRIGTS
jgi:hypothetical protein